MTVVAQIVSSPKNKHRSLIELRAPRLLDKFLLTLVLALVGFSLLMLYSTTGTISQEKFGDPYYFVSRQSVAALAGFVAMLFCSQFSVSLYRKISGYCLPLCVVLLILPLIPGLGSSSGGATRWVNFGFVRFQPGEIVKLLFVIYMAGYFTRHESTLKNLADGVVKPCLLIGLIASLFLLEPEFGSAAVSAGVVCAMGLAVGIPLRYFGILASLATIAGSILVYTSPYRMSRVLSFLAPWKDSSGKGYQLMQSLIAVGSGEFSGVGLGASQQKLFYLPAAHTDFIFAVVAEELGFIGAVILLMVFLAILWRGISLASKLSADVFAYALCVGATLLIVLPAFLNVGVVIGVLPTKGMVLPLVGYGGTNLVVSLATVGVILSLTRFLYKNR